MAAPGSAVGTAARLACASEPPDVIDRGATFDAEVGVTFVEARFPPLERTPNVEVLPLDERVEPEAADAAERRTTGFDLAVWPVDRRRMATPGNAAEAANRAAPEVDPCWATDRAEPENT